MILPISLGDALTDLIVCSYAAYLHAHVHRFHNLTILWNSPLYQINMLTVTTVASYNTFLYPHSSLGIGRRVKNAKV